MEKMKNTKIIYLVAVLIIIIIKKFETNILIIATIDSKDIVTFA